MTRISCLVLRANWMEYRGSHYYMNGELEDKKNYLRLYANHDRQNNSSNLRNLISFDKDIEKCAQSCTHLPGRLIGSVTRITWITSAKKGKDDGWIPTKMVRS